MGVESLEREGHRVGGEILDLELAAAAPVQRVGATGTETGDIEVRGATSDFLVGRKGDPHRSVPDFRVRHQIFRRRHDLGDTRFVVRAQQRQSRRGDDVLADARRE